MEPTATRRTRGEFNCDGSAAQGVRGGSRTTIVREKTRLRELASGIDALYLSARGILPPGLHERLESTRRFADRVRLKVPFELGGRLLGLAPHAWGRYRYCLEDAVARVGLTTSEHLPTVRVQTRAEALHSLGAKGTAEAVASLLAPELGRLNFSVSRLDVFCDVQGLELDASDAGLFVCRADTRRTYEESGRLTGFTFGARRTKTLFARLYDKTADVEAKGTTWWYEVWGDRFRRDAPVWRLEFEVGRDGLNEFGLSDVDEVLTGTGDIWAYATAEWLTLRLPTGDATRSRWPVSPQWPDLQRASLSSANIGAERITAARKASSLARLLPGLTGYLASFGALAGTEGIPDTVDAAIPHLQDYGAMTRTPFAERVERKRLALEQ